MKSPLLLIFLLVAAPPTWADELIATCKLESGKSATLSWNTAANALKLQLQKKNKPPVVILSKIPAVIWKEDGLVEKRYFFESNEMRFQFIATKDDSRARVPVLISRARNGGWFSEEPCTKSEVRADFNRPSSMPIALDSMEAFTAAFGKDWVED